MREKIANILKINNQIEEYKSLILSKENDILSCEKSIQNGSQNLIGRQKNAVNSLYNLNQEKSSLENELKELLKSFSPVSFQNKKANSSLIYNCISLGIAKKDLDLIKSLYEK